MISREATHIFFCTPTSDMLPLVSLTCPLCGMLVDLTKDDDTYTVSRVKGDSANGYEPFHMACIHEDEAPDPDINDEPVSHPSLVRPMRYMRDDALWRTSEDNRFRDREF